MRRSIITGIACTLLPIAGSVRAYAQDTYNGSTSLDFVTATQPLVVMTDVNNVAIASAKYTSDLDLLSYGYSGRPLSVKLRTAFPAVHMPDNPLSLDILPYDLVSFPDHHHHDVSTPIGHSYFSPILDGNTNNGDGTSYYYSDEGGGKSLRAPTGSWGSILSYITPQGDQVNFGSHTTYGENALCQNPDPLLADNINFADGEVWTYYYATYNGKGCPAENTYGNEQISRPKFIVSNRGYGLQFSYKSDVSTDKGWNQVTSITFYNKGFYYCDETTLIDCAVIANLSSKALISDVPNGSGEIVTMSPSQTAGLKLTMSNHPDHFRSYYNADTVETVGLSGSLKNIFYTNDLIANQGYDGDPTTYQIDDYVNSISYGGKTWTYSPGNRQDPNGYAAYEVDADIGQPASFTYVENVSNNTGFTWTWNYQQNGALASLKNPENDGYSFIRDARGNVTSSAHTPKPGSSLASTTATATYAASCSNTKICNKPTAVVDENGHETDFTYDPNSGGVLTETGPAVNGVRPQKRNAYVQRYAWILNSSGGYVRASSPIWVLASESHCRASAATGNLSSPCTSNDEVLTQYDYGPDSGPNNLFLRGVVVQADGQTRRSCYSYDQFGHKISETAPRAALLSCY